MRIISQDKMRDINYDNVNLKIASPGEWLDDNIFNSKLFWGILTTTNISLGGYTSKEKALKVKEMIREKHLEIDVDYYKEIKRYGAPDTMLVNKKYFYMPKDEDVK